MNKYRRYVFTEANRQFKLQSGNLPLSYFITRSWKIARMLFKEGIEPYC